MKTFRLFRIGFVGLLLLGWLAAMLLVGCSAYQSPATTTQTQGNDAVTLTPTPVMVTTRGTVYLRDKDGDIQGWLDPGTTVEAFCTGDWCYIAGGQLAGLRFWRGCAEDNPDGLGCKKAGEK